MLTFNHRIAYEFDRLVKARISAISDLVVDGDVPDMERLRRYQGQVAGLREATELLEEAISISEGKHD